MRKEQANGAGLKGATSKSMNGSSIFGKKYSTTQSQHVKNYSRVLGRNMLAKEHQSVEDYRDQRARFIENRYMEIQKKQKQLETVSRRSDKSPVAGRIFRMNHARS